VGDGALNKFTEISDPTAYEQTRERGNSGTKKKGEKQGVV